MSEGNKGTAVVTGAASGIGHAICHRLLAEGYRVHGLDLAAIEGAPFPTLRVDVSDRAAVFDAIARVSAQCDGIDALITCAAVFKAVPFLQLTQEEWDRTLAVNLNGTLWACQAVLPQMIARRRGSIVMFSSSLARAGAVAGGHYAASKGGVLGLARSLAQEVADRNVRVNVISPGLTDTPQPRANASEAVIYAKADTIPLRRIGMPDDMADAALFLLGDGSSFVTGQDIRINGGANLF